MFENLIENALKYGATGEKVVVHAAGRTDAGVHGLGMRAHLEIVREIGAFRLMEALNARLRPHPVAILDCAEVPDDWHARFSCVARHYEYRIVTRRAPLTWEKGLAWRIPSEIDAVGAMRDEHWDRHIERVPGGSSWPAVTVKVTVVLAEV